MKIKQTISLIIVLLILGSLSILVHELVHILQGYFMFGIDISDMELHFFWEGEYLNLPWYYFPIAWVVMPGIRNTFYLELMAYSIQFVFMVIMYEKFIYKNPRFE